MSIFVVFDGVTLSLYIYGVTSVERGHLADGNQNVAKDLNYYQHKSQEHH